MTGVAGGAILGLRLGGARLTTGAGGGGISVIVALKTGQGSCRGAGASGHVAARR
jgi:hypothetical protein